jgi:serine/threonine protein kinase
MMLLQFSTDWTARLCAKHCDKWLPGDLLTKLQCCALQHRYEYLISKRTSLSKRVPEADQGCLDFLAYMLTIDPMQRPSAEEALQHPWLLQQYPVVVD